MQEIAEALEETQQKNGRSGRVSKDSLIKIFPRKQSQRINMINLLEENRDYFGVPGKNDNYDYSKLMLFFILYFD